MKPRSFVKLSGFYRGFLDHFTKANNQILAADYNTIHRALMAEGFSWADFLPRYLNQMGYQATEVVTNYQPLINAYLRGAGHSPKTQPHEAILLQLKELKPEVLFIQDTNFINRYWFHRIKDEVKSIRKVIGWRCSPYLDSELAWFKEFDLMLSCNPRLVEEFQLFGVHSELFHHGFEPSQAPQISVEKFEIAFAGSLIQNKGFHLKRTEFLIDLIEKGLPLTVFAQRPQLRKILVQKIIGKLVATSNRALFSGKQIQNQYWSRALMWSDIPVTKSQALRLRRYLQGEVFGKALYQSMAQAKVNLNFHIDSSGCYAGNARLFEATGVGSCLLTDAKKNLGELFEVGKEVLAYSSQEECVELAEKLLKDDHFRKKIAKAGQKRCFQDHSFQKRAQQLDKMISEI